MCEVQEQKRQLSTSSVDIQVSRQEGELLRGRLRQPDLTRRIHTECYSVPHSQTPQFPTAKHRFLQGQSWGVSSCYVAICAQSVILCHFVTQLTSSTVSLRTVGLVVAVWLWYASTPFHSLFANCLLICWNVDSQSNTAPFRSVSLCLL